MDDFQQFNVGGLRLRYCDRGDLLKSQGTYGKDMDTHGSMHIDIAEQSVYLLA